MTLDQHPLFTDDLVEVTDPLRPRWMPRLDLDPDWRIDTQEFPHVKDKALIEEETDRG